MTYRRPARAFPVRRRSRRQTLGRLDASDDVLDASSRRRQQATCLVTGWVLPFLNEKGRDTCGISEEIAFCWRASGLKRRRISSTCLQKLLQIFSAAMIILVEFRLCRAPRNGSSQIPSLKRTGKGVFGLHGRFSAQTQS